MSTTPTDVQSSRNVAEPNDLAVRPEPPFWHSVLKTARPKQWAKNVLVFAAPAAAGDLTHSDVLGKSILAAVAFVLASVGTYFINDAIDAEADRLHPKKRFRPMAAGWMSIRLGATIGTVCLAAAMVGSAFILNARFTGLIATYVALTLSYSFRLKRVPVFDLACVAGGFIIRMIAGGVATDEYISEWFLAVGCFCSLFIVTGKRYAEVREMGEGNAASRAVLAEYNINFLRAVWTMSMTVAVLAYFQWTYSRPNVHDSLIWYQLSAIPWVLALMRYALRLENGHGGAPEEVLTSDRVLIGLGLVWVVLFAVGVYVA